MRISLKVGIVGHSPNISARLISGTAGITNPGKSGIAIPGKSGTSIPGKSGTSMPGKSGIAIPGKSGIVIAGHTVNEPGIRQTFSQQQFQSVISILHGQKHTLEQSNGPIVKPGISGITTPGISGIEKLGTFGMTNAGTFGIVNA